MIRQLIIVGAVGILAACVSAPGGRDLAGQCKVKYPDQSLPGTVPAKLISPLRPSMDMLRNYPSSYACVAVSVNEGGEVTGAKVLETNTPQLGDEFVRMAFRAKYEPGTLNGKTVPTRLLISLGID